MDRQTRPAVDRRSQLFQRTVSYLKGTRLFVPTSRVRRKGLMKQFKAAPRFRERVGIRKKLFGTVQRGTAGEAMVRRILDDESDCGSCQSRRKKTKLPADLYYKKRKAALARKKAHEILTEDEDDHEQPGYDTDSDPGHRPLGKGPRSPPDGGEGAKEAVVYSFEDTYGGAASAATMQVILDSGASRNVIPQGVGEEHPVGTSAGPSRVPYGGWNLDPQFGDDRDCPEV